MWKISIPELLILLMKNVEAIKVRSHGKLTLHLHTPHSYIAEYENPVTE